MTAKFDDSLEVAPELAMASIQQETMDTEAVDSSGAAGTARSILNAVCAASRMNVLDCGIETVACSRNANGAEH
ncbi:MAG: hypothetical protein EOO38_10605 [Cytophagaceae bacterium]|nr:MAG: hypothetical protein EOO38_10605 [Cytophagaceae bacterium]